MTHNNLPQMSRGELAAKIRTLRQQIDSLNLELQEFQHEFWRRYLDDEDGRIACRLKFVLDGSMEMRFMGESDEEGLR